MTKILVIENDAKHLSDAQKYFATIQNVEVAYVTNYNDARKFISGSWDNKTHQTIKENADGVISDIYFPYGSDAKYDQPEPIGVRVAIELSQLGVPFVLNTAGYHHGKRYQWICEMARNQNWTVIDSGHDHEKDWPTAYKLLLEKLEGKKYYPISFCLPNKK